MTIPLAVERPSADPARHAPRPERFHPRPAAAVFTTALLVLATSLAYGPWIAAPFDKAISDFFPLLPADGGFRAGAGALHDYYKADGRFTPVYMTVLALEWTMFRDRTLGWQLFAFALIAADVILAAWLFVRLRITPLAAGLGAGLLLLCRAIAPPILFVHWIAEPFATGLMLVAAHLSLSLHVRQHYAARLLAIALLFIACVWTKETFVAVAPFLVLLGACHAGSGAWSPPRPDRRTIGVVMVIALAALVAAIPVIMVRLSAPAAAYGAAYGMNLGSIGLRDVLTVAEVMTMPNPSARPYPTNVLLVVLGLACLVVAWRGWRGGKSTPWPWLVAASLPLAGFLIYLPWPSLGAWYGIPYLVGTGMFLALGLDSLERSGKRAHSIALATYAVIAVIALRDAHTSAGMNRAMHRAEGRVTTTVADDPSILTFIHAGRRVDGWLARMWRRWLPLHAASGVAPSAHVLDCESAAPFLSQATSAEVVMSVRGECPAIEAAARTAPWLTIVERTRAWGLRGIERDSVVIDLRRGARPPYRDSGAGTPSL